MAANRLTEAGWCTPRFMVYLAFEVSVMATRTSNSKLATGKVGGASSTGEGLGVRDLGAGASAISRFTNLLPGRTELVQELVVSPLD